MDIFEKNRDRELPDFANINFLGKCNVNCYFCLGKDISELIDGYDHRKTPPDQLPRLPEFLDLCKNNGIKKIYLTGQNVDSLQYEDISHLITSLKLMGFQVGLRTNGYLASEMMSIVNMCDLSVGYSIHTLNCAVNKKIMGRFDIPRWDKIIPATNNPRVSIVVNRHNAGEFEGLVRWLSQFPNVKYIQARRISTDTRQEELLEDVELYEVLYDYVKAAFPFVRNFYDAEIYNMYGKEVCFWRTVKTSISSFNYFSDGTISEEYFIVEGYKKNKVLV